MVEDKQNIEQSGEIAAEEQSRLGAGLGVNILELSRIKSAIKKHPRILERAFSEQEIAFAKSRKNTDVYHALHFAAKGAVRKALGLSQYAMGIRDVEVLHDKNDHPHIELSGQAAAKAADRKVKKVFISLSYTHDTAVASAVAPCEDDIPKHEEIKTQSDFLAERFKDVRFILDEIEDTKEGEGQ